MILKPTADTPGAPTPLRSVARLARHQGRQALGLALSWLMMTWAGGCALGPQFLPNGQPIDRTNTEYPAGSECKQYITNLTAPTAITWDNDGTVIVAESGEDGSEPQILGWKAGKQITIYPSDRRIPFSPFQPGFEIYGPVTAMVSQHHFVYVAHRDQDGRGVITRFDFQGHHLTLIADIPSFGDYGLTDLAVNEKEHRVYFGVGSATNSGVVGLDNILEGWVKRHPNFCDMPAVEIHLLGLHFQTKNPFATLFGGNDIAVTAPYQPFRISIEDTIRKAPNGRPTGCVCSIDINGGDLKIEATGLRYPRGLGFNEYGRLYFTDEGMELRGTRPIKDDPDVLFRLVPQADYGRFDYSRDLHPITDERYQPPVAMILGSGFKKILFLVDHAGSGLQPPNRDLLLAGVFQPLSGAAKFDFCPGSGFFKKWEGDAIVALWGDRAPFATSGMKMTGPTGYKLVRVNTDTKQVEEFVRNTTGLPSSLQRRGLGLERPIDAKFGPDGALYIVDFGKLEMRGGREKITPRTGAVYRLSGISDANP